MATGVSKSRWKDKRLGDSLPAGGSELTLTYEGKKPSDVILGLPGTSMSTLWSGQADKKAAARNRLYFGDNLQVLATLLNDPTVKGKVKLVYIDPPFATRSVFQSRTQVDAYSDLLAGAHYIEFLRERLILLRELLAIDGSIYVHLDGNMAFHVKVIMDEIFGSRNFRSWITRMKCNPKNYTRKVYGNVSDYVLFYTKSDSYLWNRPVEPWTSAEEAKEYRYVDPGSNRRYMKVPIHAPGTRNGATGQPWRGVPPPPGKHWQFPPATLDEMDARGEIYWSPRGNPRRKVFLDMHQGVPVQDVWLDFRDAHNQNVLITGYPTEKNPDLLSRIVRASSKEGDLVLDCFVGSGTTLSVCSQLRRPWIGVDNSPEAIATCLRRFSVGPERMGDYVSKSPRTSRKPAELQVPSLFGLEEPPPMQNRSVQTAKINDFCLYATMPYRNELANALASWQS